MTEETVSATLTIAAPAERMFAVLTDPTTHASIDGTGWVQESIDRAPLTAVGQVFEAHRFELVDGRPTDSGVPMATYRPR